MKRTLILGGLMLLLSGCGSDVFPPVAPRECDGLNEEAVVSLIRLVESYRDAGVPEFVSMHTTIAGLELELPGLLERREEQLGRPLTSDEEHELASKLGSCTTALVDQVYDAR